MSGCRDVIGNPIWSGGLIITQLHTSRNASIIKAESRLAEDIIGGGEVLKVHVGNAGVGDVGTFIYDSRINRRWVNSISCLVNIIILGDALIFCLRKNVLHT